MDVVFACVLAFLSFAADPALSLQCYNCTAAEANCFDTFNTEGIQMVNCDGECYGEQSMVEGEFSGTFVTRGCIPNTEVCFPGCIDALAGYPPEMTPPPGFGGEICRYCCGEELCNDQPIDQTARQQAPPPVEGTRNCWKCEEAYVDATAGSCASDDFNGSGAEQVSCDGKCVLFTGPNDQGVVGVSRQCDAFNAICSQPGVPAGSCCTEELCNGNAEPGGGDGDGDGDGDGNGDGDGDGDGDVRPIDCWTCIDALGSPCEKGKTVSFNQTTCPIGKCVTLVSKIATESVFIRGCLEPTIGEGICEDGALKNDFVDFSEVKCCDKNLCNDAPLVTSSLSLILLSTLYVLVSRALM